MAGKRRIGILTGGGDCPGLNPVIRAVVKRGVTQLGFEIVGIRDSFNGLLSDPYRVVELDRESVRGILTKGGTILGTTNKGNPFAFPTLLPDGTTSTVDRSKDIIEAARILELDGIISIGGDGTLSISHQLSKLGLKVVSVPKTIDNDIPGTDVTFGFNTAVEIATEAIDRLHTTAESHDRVMVIEVMGRDCGWIALHAGIAGGADAILIPEIPYDLGRVADKVRRRQAKGRRFSIIVVAEGAKEQGGEQHTIAPAAAGATMPRLGGAGHYVAQEIEKRTRIETRVTVLGHLQRGGTPTARDRILSTRFGAAAIDFVLDDKWGHMTGLVGREIVPVPIEQVVGKLKRVDVHGQTANAARQLSVELGA